MTQRITTAMLESQIKYLNELVGANTEPYTKQPDGKIVANIGTYYLSGAYGGWCLDLLVSQSGACGTTLNTGYVPKKELYYAIRSFIRGIELGKELGK